jgi:hypothetical protein
MIGNKIKLIKRERVGERSWQSYLFGSVAFAIRRHIKRREQLAKYVSGSVFEVYIRPGKLLVHFCYSEGVHQEVEGRLLRLGDGQRKTSGSSQSEGDG